MLFEPDTEALEPGEVMSHCVRRLSNGAKVGTVRADLVARGIEARTAAKTVHEALVIKTDAFRKKGWDGVLMGGVVFTVGAILIGAVMANGGIVMGGSCTLGGLGYAVYGAWLVVTNPRPATFSLAGTAADA